MSNEGLSEVIDHLSYVKKTHTIIVSGEKNAVAEVLTLLQQFDSTEHSRLPEEIKILMIN